MAKIKRDRLVPRTVTVSDKQAAMLCEALGLIDHCAPHFREAALVFARNSDLTDAVQFLERAEETRKKLRQKAIGKGLFDGDLATGS